MTLGPPWCSVTSRCLLVPWGRGRCCSRLVCGAERGDGRCREQGGRGSRGLLCPQPGSAQGSCWALRPDAPAASLCIENSDTAFWTAEMLMQLGRSGYPTSIWRDLGLAWLPPASAVLQERVLVLFPSPGSASVCGTRGSAQTHPIPRQISNRRLQGSGWQEGPAPRAKRLCAMGQVQLLPHRPQCQSSAAGHAQLLLVFNLCCRYRSSVVPL